jgi:hypothetical protein
MPRVDANLWRILNLTSGMPLADIRKFTISDLRHFSGTHRTIFPSKTPPARRTIMSTGTKRQASEIDDLYSPPKRANTNGNSIPSLLASIEGEFQRRQKDKEDSFLKWVMEGTYLPYLVLLFVSIDKQKVLFLYSRPSPTQLCTTLSMIATLRQTRHKMSLRGILMPSKYLDRESWRE